MRMVTSSDRTGLPDCVSKVLWELHVCAHIIDAIPGQFDDKRGKISATDSPRTRFEKSRQPLLSGTHETYDCGQKC